MMDCPPDIHRMRQGTRSAQVWVNNVDLPLPASTWTIVEIPTSGPAERAGRRFLFCFGFCLAFVEAWLPLRCCVPADKRLWPWEYDGARTWMRGLCAAVGRGTGPGGDPAPANVGPRQTPSARGLSACVTAGCDWRSEWGCTLRSHKKLHHGATESTEEAVLDRRSWTPGPHRR